MIGAMAMPANFQYRDVFIKGYPQHERFDSFRLKHPAMDYGRRAKIFSPFDALKGFNEAFVKRNDANSEAERDQNARPIYDGQPQGQRPATFHLLIQQLIAQLLNFRGHKASVLQPFPMRSNVGDVLTRLF